MRVTGALALKIPVLAACALALAGCYTMLSHPGVDATEDEYVDSSYGDCGACHSAGFSQPILNDPYRYVASPFQDYYDCPWWLPDCGSGLGVYPGGSGVADADDADARHGVKLGGRQTANRGGVRHTPPSFTPSPGDAAGTGAGSLQPAGTGATETGELPPRGRKMKTGEDAGKTDPATPQDPRQDNRKPQEKTQEKP